MTYIEPLLTIFFVIALVGLVCQSRSRGTRLAAVGVAGLFLCAWPPVDWLFSRPLEIWYPVQPFHAGAAQAIVVFSSSVQPLAAEPGYSQGDEETYRRTAYAAWLFRHGHSVPVLACGGSASRNGAPYSLTMRRLLAAFGVPADRIWLEERSQTTHENAVFGSQILHQHGISSVALVVDASSMLRAAACLRKAGIQVVPAPSSFRELGTAREEVLPSWKAIRQNERTLHEIGGLGWYWLRGWI